jgi:hypothetical protein
MKKESLRHASVVFILILNLILLGLLGFSGQAAGAGHAASFIDIEGHWAEEEIEAWAARNLTGGYPDGTFQPDRPVARVEFFAWLNRVFGFPAAESSVTQNFTDIMGTEWYAADIEKAVAAGYLGVIPMER